MKKRVGDSQFSRRGYNPDLGGVGFTFESMYSCVLNHHTGNGCISVAFSIEPQPYPKHRDKGKALGSLQSGREERGLHSLADVHQNSDTVPAV